MAAYPITNAQFEAFISADDGFVLEKWWKGLSKPQPSGEALGGVGNFPATEVFWNDATAFCRWLGKRLARKIRLPTEWEWQWASQSARAGFRYPWGTEWREDFANTEGSRLAQTVAVGLYPNGKSQQGVFDLAGNVWEWSRNLYVDKRDTLNNVDSSRCVRGGSCLDRAIYAQAIHRDAAPAGLRSKDLGFRVVCA